MDTQEIIAAPRDEIARLSGALELLTRGTKRIGRPPKNSAIAAPVKRRIVRTPEQRKAQAARMRAYWKNKRKSAAK